MLPGKSEGSTSLINYSLSVEDSPQELRREDGKGIEVAFVIMRVNTHVLHNGAVFQSSEVIDQVHG